MDENTMIITDETGREFQVDILFTFDAENGKHYVLFTDPSDEENEVYAYTYDDDGNLQAVDNEEELSMCQEVLGAFQSDGEDDEEA